MSDSPDPPKAKRPCACSGKKEGGGKCGPGSKCCKAPRTGQPPADSEDAGKIVAVAGGEEAEYVETSRAAPVGGEAATEGEEETTEEGEAATAVEEAAAEGEEAATEGEEETTEEGEAATAVEEAAAEGEEQATEEGEVAAAVEEAEDVDTSEAAAEGEEAATEEGEAATAAEEAAAEGEEAATEEQEETAEEGEAEAAVEEAAAEGEEAATEGQEETTEEGEAAAAVEEPEEAAVSEEAEVSEDVAVSERMAETEYEPMNRALVGGVVATEVEDVPYDSSDEIFDPWCDPKNPHVLTFEEVTSAAFRIRGGIIQTPCMLSHLSRLTGMEIYLKKDFMQRTGSFKERGARNTLLLMTEEQQNKGVVAASAGNHAQAVCYHGKDLGIPTTVVMPTIAPLMKIQMCRISCGKVILQGKDMGEAKKIAMKYAKDNDMLYVNGYDHPHVLAGQGTLGLEIVEQVNDIDAVVCPVGGGSCLAGVAVAMKALSPNTKIIGVEAENCPAFTNALAAGKPVYTKSIPSLADGLAVPVVGYNSFATAAPLIDKMITVKEEFIAVAILRLLELEKCVVEGAGACGLGAVLQGDLDEYKGKRIVLILSGGNIDTTVLGRCVERGLAADGRLVKFSVVVVDKPGGISELCQILTDEGISIKDMEPERAFTKNDIFGVKMKVVCETRDADHTAQMKEALIKRYGQSVNFDTSLL